MLLTTERRLEIENLLTQVGQPFSVSMFGGTEHGFAVRANLSDPQQKYGKESAFVQAIRFFDLWL